MHPTRFSAACLHEYLQTCTPPVATGLVVGLSGGADSAALLNAAAGLGSGFRGLTLRAVHVDHGLQAAAAEFREACAKLCLHLNVPLTVLTVAVDTSGKQSVEAAARDARYAALAQNLRQGECLLTAHHREDQAQTLLLQALRGAGIKGLSAMPACTPFGAGWHVRPLLAIQQCALLAYLRELAPAPVDGSRHADRPPPADDPMNDDSRFDRVYLRRAVWPHIATRWPGAATALSRSAQHAAEAQSTLDRVAEADVAFLRDGDALSVTGLRSLDAAARVQAVRYWLREAGVEPPPTLRLKEALRQVLAAQSDRLPVVKWGASALRRYRDRLFLTEAAVPRLDGERSWRVAQDSELELGSRLGTLRWTLCRGGISADRLPATVAVRRRMGGEKLKPEALARTTSVQHLCQTHGVLPWLRDALPLVFAGDVLIAVADLWLDACRRVDHNELGFGVVWQSAPIIV